MKTTVNQKSLLTACNTVSKVIQRNSNLPILTHAKLRTGAGGYLEITGTDLDNTVSVIIPDVVTAPEQFTAGAISVNAKRFADTVKLCHDDIALESLPAGLSVKNGSTFNLATLPADDFPPAPVITSPVIMAQVNAGELRAALASVAPAQSTDESRYILNGTYFEFSETSLTLTATDGRRLIRASLPCSAALAGKDHAVVVSIQTVTMLLALLPKTKKTGADGTVRMQFDASKGSFAFDSGAQQVEITAKLIDGNYPNYRQVIPENFNHDLRFDPEQFAQCIKTAAVCCTEKANSVKLTFSGNVMTVTSNSPELGCGESVLPCAYNDPREFAIAFNPEYLRESALASVGRGEFTLRLIDELSPCVMTAGENWLSVIMPMRMA